MGYQLGRLAVLSQGKELRVPIYVDLSLLKAGTPQAMDRAIRDFVAKSNVPIALADNLKNGAFIIVVDNFEKSQRDAAAQERKTKMIEDFIQQHPKNKYILLADQSEAATLLIVPKHEYSFDH